MEPLEDGPISKVLATLVTETQEKLKDHAYRNNVTQIRELLERDDDLHIYRSRRGWVYDIFRDVTHPRGLWRRSIETDSIGPDTNWETVFDIDAYAA